MEHSDYLCITTAESECLHMLLSCHCNMKYAAYTYLTHLYFTVILVLFEIRYYWLSIQYTLNDEH
jgi:hypothetical protein